MLLTKCEKTILEKLSNTLENPEKTIQILRQDILDIQSPIDQTHISQILSGEKLLGMAKQPSVLHKQNLLQILLDTQKLVKNISTQLATKFTNFNLEKPVHNFEKKGFLGVSELKLDHHKDRVL